VINNPSKGLYYAASVAAPAFKEIADRLCDDFSTRTYATLFENHDEQTLPFVDKMNSNDLRNLLAYTNAEKVSFDENEGWLKVKPKNKKIDIKDYSYSRK